MTGQPDVAGAVLALDQAMIALAVAKSTLLGETSMPLDPYGSAKHGVFGGSAAEVAEGVEPWGPDDPAKGMWTGNFEAIEDARNGGRAPYAKPTGHLPQHTGRQAACTYCGEHHVAVTR